ncbi:hypothetical protein BW723_17410 [Polaribacter reichenbachii]|uniref:Cyclic nucleotide-binding domain-containing protein n=1 Tax=Polaribacter reichenbachii TaxID=996801 RepID=A0A1B8U4Y1_9FLAO|nr:Crp/Fnr family transcriptional regulator [Polaribacter reichenbachii]APZ47965.1 hypothetical protein BW723_17410 [Polaribacter reichenbachii]AUC18599.1 hypothetical protein BTO17_07820 [Polaribacter reichenbachii]OBY66894.1 hypothetical protein LPB301_04715 [Polaribacter reichenbachii]
MLHDQLKQNIQKSVEISKSDLESICQNFKHSIVKKGDFLVTQGKVCKFEGFVNEGCFRIFTIDQKGNENTLYFAVKGWWLMDVDSFMNQTPSALNIQALEDSEILSITKIDKEQLYKTKPIVEKLFRVMSQKALIAWQKRLIQNHTLTAKERYYHFIEKYPKMVSKLTDRQVSSYLGITHEFLSKIKRTKAKK